MEQKGTDRTELEVKHEGLMQRAKGIEKSNINAGDRGRPTRRRRFGVRSLDEVWRQDRPKTEGALDAPISVANRVRYAWRPTATRAVARSPSPPLDGDGNKRREGAKRHLMGDDGSAGKIKPTRDGVVGSRAENGHEQIEPTEECYPNVKANS